MIQKKTHYIGIASIRPLFLSLSLSHCLANLQPIYPRPQRIASSSSREKEPKKCVLSGRHVFQLTKAAATTLPYTCLASHCIVQTAVDGVWSGLDRLARHIILYNTVLSPLTRHLARMGTNHRHQHSIITWGLWWRLDRVDWMKWMLYITKVHKQGPRECPLFSVNGQKPGMRSGFTL